MVRGRRLRSGFSTGACAAAATKGATSLLLGLRGSVAVLRLPWGDPLAKAVPFHLVNIEVDRGTASCGVVKDAGDDPDVTDGVEVRASVSWKNPSGGEGNGGAGSSPRLRQGEEASVPILIEGGEGVGRVTKPGLAVSVGQAAINPVPRQMIRAGVRDVLAEAGFDGSGALRVVISVPRGREVAQKTLNARLGILGGLSILGTTGIVIPMSADAWKATIDSGLDVAKAGGLDRAVLSHGRSSEAAAQRLFPELPSEAFVLMGDHVGFALDAAASRGLSVLMAGQFAKFCKVAAGYFDTHVKDSTLDLAVVSRLLLEAGFPEADAERALGANTAREVFHQLLESGDRGVFSSLVRRVASRASERIHEKVEVEAILFGYDKTELARHAIRKSRNRA